MAAPKGNRYGKQFGKGQRINRAGVSKEMVEFSRQWRAVLADRLNREGRLNKLADKLISIALGGNLGAIQEIVDRMGGKSTQPIELSGMEGLADAIREARQRVELKESWWKENALKES